MSHFDSVWNAWPANGKGAYREYDRKKDRKKCLEVWTKKKLDAQAAVILRDVEQRSRYDKAWLKDGGKYLCAPLVYLNNERWLDGEFNDVRDARAGKRPTAPAQIDEGPQMSRWARYANRVMFQLAYKNKSRGFVPIGDKLPSVLSVKKQIVEDAERSASMGDPWTDDDFKDIVYTSIERAMHG